MSKAKLSLIPAQEDLSPALPEIPVSGRDGYQWSLGQHLGAYQDSAGRGAGAGVVMQAAGGATGVSGSVGYAPNDMSSGVRSVPAAVDGMSAGAGGSVSMPGQMPFADNRADFDAATVEKIATELYGDYAATVLAPELSFWQRLRANTATPKGIAIVFVVALAVCGAAWFIWVTGVQAFDSSAKPVDKSSVADSENTGFYAPSSLGDPPEIAANSGGSQQKVTVHVVGEVHNPGLYTLTPGARVSDAVTAAGGPLETAQLQQINIARALQDGEQIRVPKEGEQPGETGIAADSGAVTSSIISLNTATAEQLQTLPKIGQKTAEKIISWRAQNGGFKSPEQLLEVEGIGQKTFEMLKPLVSV